MNPHIIPLLLAASLATAALPAEFHVAPNGADANPGTCARPFATLHRAQEAVRAERAAHPDQGVTVTFRGGSYPLERTLEFT